LFKRFSSINASKYFYVDRLCDIWNSLPVTVHEAPSVTVFRRLLDNVDFFICMNFLTAATVVTFSSIVKVFFLVLRAWISGLFKPFMSCERFFLIKLD